MQQLPQMPQCPQRKRTGTTKSAAAGYAYANGLVPLIPTAICTIRDAVGRDTESQWNIRSNVTRSRKVLRRLWNF